MDDTTFDWRDYLNVNDEELEGWKDTIAGHTREIIVLGLAGGTIILIVTGSSLVVNAVVLGTITTLGGVLLYLRLPEWLRRGILRFSVVLDVAAATVTYLVFGQTATAILASGIVWCMTSGLLWFASQRPADGSGPALVRS